MATAARGVELFEVEIMPKGMLAREKPLDFGI